MRFDSTFATSGRGLFCRIGIIFVIEKDVFSGISAVHSSRGEVAGVGEDERSLIPFGHQSDPEEAGYRGWNKSYIGDQLPRCHRCFHSLLLRRAALIPAR